MALAALPARLLAAAWPEKAFSAPKMNAAMVELFGVDPLAPFVARAKEDGWRLQEIAAGHDAMVTHPQEVADALISELTK